MFAITLRDEVVVFATKESANEFTARLGIPSYPMELSAADERLATYLVKRAEGLLPFFVYAYRSSQPTQAAPCTIWEYCAMEQDEFGELVWAADDASAKAAYDASRAALTDQ